MNSSADATHQSVQDYYGTTLRSSADLQTSACCALDDIPAYVKPVLGKIHPEVTAKFYGCGLVLPPLLEGMSVLDLGCGSGQDCFVLSALVGEHGRVVGVDMTDEQLEVASRHVDFHREAFGYGRSNVSFLKGYIEQLDQLGLAESSFDIIVSNCVINLSPDKPAVLEQAWRLLKPGGEMYFSDVYADRRLPAELVADPLLYGECLGGALYWNDFIHVAKRTGFLDPRLVTDRPLAINNPALAVQLEGIGFYSATYRLFKLPELEPACEDYGQAVVYKGTVPHSPGRFVLDNHHVMETGKVFPVCGNTWRMLHETRLRPHFEFIGDFSRHYGIFEGCGTALPFRQAAEPPATGGCC